MRSILTVCLLLLVLPLQAGAQVLGFNGDGFEACPRQALSVTTSASWSGTFSSAFPNAGPANVIIPPANGSIAFSFVAPSAGQSGTLLAQNRPGVVGESAISLSRCDSVFPSNPPACIDGPSVAPALAWTTTAAGSECRLEPGQTYYLNITFGVETTSGNGQPWCGVAPCGVSLQSAMR